MSALLPFWPGRSSTRAEHPAVARVAGATTFELVPLKNLDDQAQHLAPGSRVSVTCSPVKGFDATLDVAERLVAAGIMVTPHLAARVVRDRAHLAELAARMVDIGIVDVFVIGGDAAEPAGDYFDAESLLADLVTSGTGLSRIGVAGYPDGHLVIERSELRRTLLAKQALITDAGLDGWVSTQMCFDPAAISKWARAERAAGLALPIRLGLPGPVDRIKLLSMGMRVGVGQSLRYLQKNAGGLVRLVAGSSYDPSGVLGDLGSDLDSLGVAGLHLFTFNQVGAAVDWQRSVGRSA